MSLIFLCELGALPDQGCKGFDLDSFNVFVVKKQQSIFIYKNRCPHMGLPLNWVADEFLDADAELIQCRSHGALFTIHQGHCVAGPCVGQQLEKISFVVKSGQLFIESD